VGFERHPLRNPSVPKAMANNPWLQPRRPIRRSRSCCLPPPGAARRRWCN